MSALAAPRRSAQEQHVYELFLGNGSYHAFGSCANPGHEATDDVVLTAGTSPRGRVCIICFEYVFDCQHPSTRKLDALRQAADEASA